MFRRLIGSVVLQLVTAAGVAYGWSVTVNEGSGEEGRPPAKGIVTVDRLNVRARPGTTYEVVAKVVKDQQLSIVGEKGEWLEILCPEGTEAWCAAKYIAPDGHITGDRVRVRSGPGVVFSVFATLDEGTVVKRIGETEGQWQRIEAPAAATVWVYGQFIDVIEPRPDPRDADEAGDAEGEKGANEEPGETDNAQVVAAGDTTGPASANDDDEGTLEAGFDGDEQEGLSKAELPTLTETDDTDMGLKAVTVDEDFVEPIDSTMEDDPSPASEVESREGTLVSLRTKATPFATHALVERRGERTVLICYVTSDFLKLQEWENHHVRMTGRPTSYEGWRTDVLKATGIQLLSP